MIFLLAVMGKTLAQCPDGMYFDVNRGLCELCFDDCSQCTGSPDDSSNNCVACKDPMKIENSGNCIPPCLLLKNCEICGLQCKVCTMSQCIQCFSPYLLFFPGCVEFCPFGFFADGSQCLPCDKSCSGCLEAGNAGCYDCQDGYEKHQGLCIKQSCGDGFVSVSEECDDAIDSNCFECKKVYCTINQFWNGSSCLNCSITCDGCLNNENHCFRCAKGFIFNQGSCEKGFCGDGILNEDEECDENHENCQNCKIVTCSSPEILKKSYFHDFQGFFLNFDRKVSCENCEIFENLTELGENPFCYCEDYQLIVEFGKDFTWNYQSSLKLVKNALGTCNEEILLTLSGSDPAFTLKIFPLKDLTTCSTHFELSTYLSSTTSIKHFNWTVSPENKEISKFLTNLNPSIPVFLLKNSAFHFFLTVQNFLGETRTGEFFRNFFNLSNLTVIVPGYLKVERKFPVFIRAKVEACEDFSESFFDWEVLHENVTKIEKYGNIVKVVNGEFDKGDKILVNVSAWIGNEKVFKTVTLIYESSEIEAVIDKRCIFSNNSEIVLNANKSTYAGKVEKLSYNWVISTKNQVILNSTSSEVLLKNDGSSYQVSLKVSKSGVSDEDSTFVNFSKQNTWISSETLKFRTGESLFFTKSENRSSWRTNTELKSSKSSTLGKFLSPSALKNPWVGTSNDCKVNLKKIIQPSGGSLQVFPKKGTAWKTFFTFKAVGWEEGHLFEFWVKVDEKYERLTDLLHFSSFRSVLPYSERLEVKVRVYGLGRSYIESFTQVILEKNEDNKTSVFNFLMKNVKNNDYEGLLQIGALMMHLVYEEIDERTVIGSGVNQLEGRFFRNHLNRILDLASLYLPTNEQLNEMILEMLFKLITTQETFTYKELLTNCLILRKRYDDFLNEEIKLKVMKILDILLKNHENLSKNLFHQLEELLLRISLSFGRTFAYDPVKMIENEKFVVQIVKCPPGSFFSQAKKTSISQNHSLFVINSDSEVNFAVINYLDEALVKFSNSSVVVQVESKGKVRGMVSMTFSDSLMNSECHSIHQKFEGKVQDSMIWCDFNSSDKLFLEIFNISSSNPSETTGISLKSIIFIIIFLVINTLWLLWGIFKDKKQSKSVFPELLQATSTSFPSSLKNCHSLLSIFLRFDAEKPRHIRIIIYNCRLLSMIFTIMKLEFFLSPFPLIVTSESFSFFLGKMMTALLKKFKKFSIKKLPDPPDLRYSPTIKLPELTVKAKYSYVRNFSESNPVNDTNFSYESELKYRKFGIFIGIIFILGLCIGTFREILLKDLHFWKIFLLTLGFDHFLVQVFSISIQYFALKRFRVLRKIVSKSMNVSTEVNNSV